MSKKPVRVAVTGAAGQIGYALLFRIASGEMLGKDQPVILQPARSAGRRPQKALKGVMMELDDCAFPLLVGMEAHGDPMTAFKDADYALLVGSRPRGPGMERAELLAVNGAIFTAQGKALNAVASRNVKVLVVGNPANTNAYIAMKSAPDLPRKNFTAMLRLDHNRAASQIAAKTGKAVADIEKLTVWGNHSPTMYADYRFATINGESVAKMINDQEWNANTFLPTVGKRGAAIIEARGLSSAASAANAAIDHMRDWALGTNGKWVTMGIPSDGQYGIPKDMMFGFPVTCENGEYKLVEGLEIDAFSQERINKTLEELPGRASRRRPPAVSRPGMLDWNPALYTRFEDERTRPAATCSRAWRWTGGRASVVDLGCGPGNSTELLVRAFPAAAVVGTDNSEPMLVKRPRAPARRRAFELGDIATWQPDAPPDLIYANAALQWVPDHETLIPRLFDAAGARAACWPSRCPTTATSRRIA